MTIDDAKKLVSKKAIARLSYKGTSSLVEVYLVYKSKKGATYLHGYKISGEYNFTPPPHWVSMELKEVVSWEVLGEYAAPRTGYKSESKLFHEVICYA